MSMMETHVSHDGAASIGPLSGVAAQPASFEAWQALVAPGDVFRHPREVLAHPTLSPAQKRALLASWASDACALEDAPGLRCLTGCRAEPVTVDAVLAALAELDRGPAGSADPPAPTRPPGRRARWFPALRRHVRRGRRDDDDPPPCPAAAAAPRPRTPSGTTALALGA